MYLFEINKNEAGQRFDKYLHKLLPKAPSSFFYKMLRKKNIVLNGKKAEGKEKLVVGDKVSLFLSEETFMGFGEEIKNHSIYKEAYQKLKGVQIVYESEHMLLLNKPSGILTQKAKDKDLSLNEWLIGYLLEKKVISEATLSTYRPSVCNRLDRNTSGLVICACSLAGSQELGRLIAEREVKKFYRLFVKGRIEKEALIEGYLRKEERTNKVKICEHKLSAEDSYIKTRYYPLKQLEDRTYLEVELMTGKTHQSRAHMASIEHPLIGDYKYGDPVFNDRYKKNYKVNTQLLHAYRLEFPKNPLLFPEGAKSFTAEEPKIFRTLQEN